MQLSAIPITFKDITAIERDFDLKSSIKKDMAKHTFQSYKESSFIWRFNLFWGKRKLSKTPKGNTP